jgi:hypothetical protein
MSFCYASIFSKLKKRNNKKLKEINFKNKLIIKKEDNKNIKLLNKQQKRTTTILATVVLFFGLAWLPQNVLTMIIEYDIQLLIFENNNFLYLFSLISHR